MTGPSLEIIQWPAEFDYLLPSLCKTEHQIIKETPFEDGHVRHTRQPAQPMFRGRVSVTAQQRDRLQDFFLNHARCFFVMIWPETGTPAYARIGPPPSVCSQTMTKTGDVQTETCDLEVVLMDVTANVEEAISQGTIPPP